MRVKGGAGRPPRARERARTARSRPAAAASCQSPSHRQGPCISAGGVGQRRTLQSRWERTRWRRLEAASSASRTPTTRHLPRLLPTGVCLTLRWLVLGQFQLSQRWTDALLTCWRRRTRAATGGGGLASRRRSATSAARARGTSAAVAVVIGTTRSVRPPVHVCG